MTPEEQVKQHLQTLSETEFEIGAQGYVYQMHGENFKEDVRVPCPRSGDHDHPVFDGGKVTRDNLPACNMCAFFQGFIQGKEGWDGVFCQYGK